MLFIGIPKEKVNKFYKTQRLETSHKSLIGVYLEIKFSIVFFILLSYLIAGILRK